MLLSARHFIPSQHHSIKNCWCLLSASRIENSLLKVSDCTHNHDYLLLFSRHPCSAIHDFFIPSFQGVSLPPCMILNIVQYNTNACDYSIQWCFLKFCSLPLHAALVNVTYLTQRKSDHEQLHQVSNPVVATAAELLLLTPIIQTEDSQSRHQHFPNSSSFAFQAAACSRITKR